MKAKYKIVVSKIGLGWRLDLYKKFLWILWLPDTECIIKRGREDIIDDQIDEWMEHLDCANDTKKCLIKYNY